MYCRGGEMACPTLKAWLYNNPLLEGAVIENILKKEKWGMRNMPHLDIVGENIRGTSAVVDVMVYSEDEKELYRGKSNIKIKNGKFRQEFKLEQSLVNPEITEIKLIQGKKTYSTDVLIKVHKIYGKVTSFGGDPIPAYFNVQGKGETIARADLNGRYELWLPEEPVKSVFIDDETYSKETLECWFREFTLTKDIEINPHIDKFEIYELHAWLTYTSVHVHFVPMSLTRTLVLFNKGKNTEEIARDPFAWPRLRKEDVEVYLNEKKAEIKTLTEHAHYVPTTKGMITCPSYILDISRREFEEARDPIIRVVATHEVNLKGKRVVERGEAYFLGFCGRVRGEV